MQLLQNVIYIYVNICVFLILTTTFKEREQKELFESMINTTIHLCGSHVMHSIKKKCESIGAKDEVKFFIMTIFCRMVTCKHYEVIKFIFRHLCIVLLSFSKRVQIYLILVRHFRCATLIEYEPRYLSSTGSLYLNQHSQIRTSVKAVYQKRSQAIYYCISI